MKDDGMRSTQEIEREIERTRRELGDTAQALVAKTDVKGRAQDRVQEIKANVRGRREELVGKAREAAPESATDGAQRVGGVARRHALPLGATAGAAALFGVGWWLGRRHAS